MDAVIPSSSNAYISEYINRIPDFKSELALSVLLSGASSYLLASPEAALVGAGLGAMATLIHAFARPFFQDSFNARSEFTINQEFCQRVFAILVPTLIGRGIQYPFTQNFNTSIQVLVSYFKSWRTEEARRPENAASFMF